MAERTADFTKVGARYRFGLAGGLLPLSLREPMLVLLVAFIVITLHAISPNDTNAAIKRRDGRENHPLHQCRGLVRFRFTLATGASVI
jgi:hypothetical protein